MQPTVRKLYGVVEYVGTTYRGWQYQGLGDQRSVSGALTHFLSQILPAEKCESFTLMGASRTDAGVHARGNAFHLQLNYRAQPIPLQAFTVGLNSILRRADHPIRVLHVREVPMEFHALQTLGKTYRYQAIAEKSVFCQDRYMLLPRMIDINKARAAAQMMVGKINILSFSKRNPTKKFDPEERVIDSIEVVTNGPEVYIDVASAGFSWFQVRYMAGCILHCGLGRMSLGEVETLLSGKSQQKAPLAPAHGLYLQEVRYDPKWFST